MKIILSLTLFAIVSCAAPSPSWTRFNPLDEPGETQPTVEEMHIDNLRTIVDPGYIP